VRQTCRGECLILRNRLSREAFLKGEKKEIWMHLCEQAAVEQDPAKLMDLIKEINKLLEEKERRLKGDSNSPNHNDDKTSGGE
jgi:hypothetical protein